MYICPECYQEFKTTNSITKHYLKCWKEHHQPVKLKVTKHYSNITVRTINNDITNFFNSLQGEN